jgi:protein TonB
MALSDFMPYGAPELLDAAPARLARATFIASSAVALVVAAFGALVGHSFGPVVAPTVDERVFEMLDFPPPPPDVVVHPEVTPSPPKGMDELSVPVPVPDAPELEVALPTTLPSPAGVPGATGSPADVPVIAGGSGAFEEPSPDVFVWTDEMPALVSCTEPRYPDLAREAGVEGVVTVRMLVGLDGRVRRAILAPHGSVPMLDQAALEAARSCVFTPALANGHAVMVWVSRQYRFRLH